MNVAGSGAKAWGFLADGFAAPAPSHDPPSWEEVGPLLNAHERLMAIRRRGLEVELSTYALDGDEPLLQDWRSFRALANAREEAWSDWLAYLLETAEPDFVGGVLGLTSLPAARPLVRRETVIPRSDLREEGRYRSDILLEWSDQRQGVHLEVKTGDQNLEKTWGEARLLRKRRPSLDWKHFMLLLPEQAVAFNSEAARQYEQPEAPLVAARTWTDVSRAVRAALKRRTGTAGWLCLAHAFAGALEQVLLRRPVLCTGRSVPKWWSPVVEVSLVGPGEGDEDDG